MNFIPAFRSTRFKMSRVLTIVIALAAFGASFATSSNLYAQSPYERYNKAGDKVAEGDREFKVFPPTSTVPLQVGDYVLVSGTASHGMETVDIPGGADFTIKSANTGRVDIGISPIGSKPAFEFVDKTENATVNLTDVGYYGSGSGGNNVFLHMNSGVSNFLTLKLNNASFSNMKGVISSGNSNSHVKIISDRYLNIYSTAFVFGNWDSQPLKVDISFTNQASSSLTLNSNTRGVCGSVAFTSGFTSESATLEIQSNSASDRGGAIYSTGDGDVSLTSTSTSNILRLSSNTANSGGFMYSDSSGDIKITSGGKLSLTNNEAYASGGAIYNEGNGSTTLVATNNEMYVNGNSAGANGGVIYNDSGENSFAKTVALSSLNGTDSKTGLLTITNNKSTNGDGGVIYNKGASVTLQSTTGLARISANTAKNGGVIYNDCSGNDEGIATVKIASTGNSVNLMNNQATAGSGGAIYSVGSNVTLEAKTKSVIIDENTAQVSGGVIYNQGEATTKITIDGNKVIATDSLANTGSGGLIYNDGASIDIKAVEELTVKRNYTPAGNGGAIYSGDYNGSAENTISIAATNSSLTISNNYAGYLYTGLDTNSNYTGSDWITDDCKGGAIYSTAKELRIAMNAQEDSTNAQSGKITFESNFATGDGGAIYNVSSATSDAALSIQNNCDGGTVTVSRNKSGGSGGAIYNANAKIDMNSMNKMSIQNNEAEGSGGAIYNSSPGYDFTLKSIALDINSNSAQENGGAIYLESKTNLINGTNLNLKYNEANGSGGAIYEVATSGGSTTFQALENIAITDNTANNGSGGAIYRTAADGATNIGDLSFFANDEVVLNRNFAENGMGGAIYNDAKSNIDFTSNRVLSIKNNMAINGGAIYQLGGGVVFDGSVIQDTPEANFFNNVATGDESTLGEALANDIFCNDKLSFKGNGVYTFNGGIYAGSTSISAADVTVYGREFIPGTQTQDTTNHFRFNATTISNDGKLTVQFDEIEDYSGVFTLEKKTENATMLELNTETKTRQLTMEQNKLQVLGNGVVKKTGNGALQIVAEAQGLVEAESFVISSGRVDFSGYVEATMDVKENATFSPGSFGDADLVGNAYVTGNVQIEDLGTALFEFGSFPGDKEDVDHHDVLFINNGSFLFDPSDSGLISLEFLKGDEGSWAVNKCWYLLIEGANVADGDYTYLLRNAGVFNLVGEGGNLYLTATIIPEPTTWALMILGAVGLLYLRRKAVKK
ncbi:MAG: PEP-CTERM sorting domain-containing protein [Thermoguttaceae bacterium]|nr:PEP-CTERM sorting domain-containing protein [Thermoguttaceae bacterium]